MPDLLFDHYIPHAGQDAIHTSTAQHRAVATGRSFGKTTLCLAEVARHARTTPGVSMLYVTPSQRMARLIYQQAKQFLAPVIVDANDTWMMLHLHNDIRDVRFLAPDTPEDYTRLFPTMLIVDDPQNEQQHLWKALFLQTQIAGGRILLVGTPCYDERLTVNENWWYDVWNRAGHATRWEQFSFPSSTNPRISEEQLTQIQSEVPPLLFRQQHLAEWLLPIEKEHNETLV